VHQDEAWKEQARQNGGLLLSIDGIQPDKGNETMYLVRAVLTERSLNADKVTDSTKDRLKQILMPVVTLCEQGTCRLDLSLMYANRAQHRVLAQATSREGLSLWQERHQVEQRLRGRQSEQGDCLCLPLACSRLPAPPERRCTAAALRLVRAWTQRPPRWERRQDRR
jgi:hypothetical protein